MTIKHGFHYSVVSRDGGTFGRKGTGSGSDSDLVGRDDFTNALEVIRGEDKSNVTLDERQETLVLTVFGEDGADSTVDHGVLAHQDYTLRRETLKHLEPTLSTFTKKMEAGCCV